jgi:PadR family transcriptional regulator, regulatory protein PadR
MARESEFRDLFPDALELMILRILDRRPRHGYVLARLRARVEDRLESEIELSARKPTVRVFKRTEAARRQLEEERSSFRRMFAGINRVLRVAQPLQMGYALAYGQLFSLPP